MPENVVVFKVSTSDGFSRIQFSRKKTCRGLLQPRNSKCSRSNRSDNQFSIVTVERSSFTAVISMFKEKKNFLKKTCTIFFSGLPRLSRLKAAISSGIFHFTFTTAVFSRLLLVSTVADTVELNGLAGYCESNLRFWVAKKTLALLVAFDVSTRVRRPGIEFRFSQT